MKAVVYRGVNDLRIEDVAEPQIQSPSDVLLKVNLSTICGGDVHLKNSEFMKPGTIIGHEYCGEVLDVGPQVSRFKKGDRVIGRPVFYCGHCYYCEHKQPDLCENHSMFGTGETPGVQAEYARIPFADNTLERIPDALSYEDVIFVGDILSTGYTGVRRGGVSVGDSVAVFGAGPIGLSSIMCAPLFGPSLVIAVDIVDYRLDFARSLGAVTINASKEDPVAKVREMTGCRGADVGIEAGADTKPPSGLASRPSGAGVEPIFLAYSCCRCLSILPSSEGVNLP